MSLPSESRGWYRVGPGLSPELLPPGLVLFVPLQAPANKEILKINGSVTELEPTLEITSKAWPRVRALKIAP